MVLNIVFVGVATVLYVTDRNRERLRGSGASVLVSACPMHGYGGASAPVAVVASDCTGHDSDGTSASVPAGCTMHAPGGLDSHREDERDGRHLTQKTTR
jgi:hypothetical protein